MNYITLRKGDILRHGDEYQDQFTGKWYPTTCVGLAVGIPLKTSQRYRRPIS